MRSGANFEINREYDFQSGFFRITFVLSEYVLKPIDQSKYSVQSCVLKTDLQYFSKIFYSKSTVSITIFLYFNLKQKLLFANNVPGVIHGFYSENIKVENIFWKKIMYKQARMVFGLQVRCRELDIFKIRNFLRNCLKKF